MPYAFNNNKERYDFTEGDLTTASGLSNSYFESFAGPWEINESKTQIVAHLDIIQVRLSVRALPTSGDIGTVAAKYRPKGPVLFSIVRDSAPYKNVGTAFLGTGGRLQFFTEAFGNVQIFGIYPVAEHN